MADTFKPLKGMIKDTGRMDQIDGSYRDAVNLIVDDQKLNVLNEYGNIQVGTLNISGILISGGGTQNVAISPIGQIALLNDNFIIFGSGQYTDLVHGVINISAIFYVNVATQIADVLYYTTDKNTLTGAVNPLGHLNFDTEHPVTGEFRVSPAQEELVYFTDNNYEFITDPASNIKYINRYNPPRVFNITKQLDSLTTTSNPSNLYGNNSRVEFLNIFLDAGRIPKFDSIEILKGGGVVTGAYYIGIAYADQDGTETNVLTVSNPVYIVPGDDTTIPRESISGAPNNTQTNKSIVWNISDINREYSYIIPYVIQYSGKARFVYKLEKLDILGTTAGVVYSGLEKSAASAIEEAVLDKVRYLTAKSITQLDNKLYAANLTSRPDLGYQRFANEIVIEAVTDTLTQFDPRHYDVYNLNEGYSQLFYPDPNTSLYPPLSGSPEGYPVGTFGTIPYAELEGMDGVTDAYISNVIVPIQRGTSAGYRDPNILFKRKGYRRGEVYAFYISFILKDGSESYAYHIPGRNIADRFELDWASLPNNIGPDGDIFKYDEILAYSPDSLPYQYLDTSYMSTINPTNNMGFWRNQNERYPDTNDFTSWAVDSSGQSIYLGNALASNFVRHHKMPSNHNASFSHVVRDTYFGSPDISTADSVYLTKASARDFSETVRILGVQLNNIKIPKFILNQVQGYRVYYAKRTEGNKTIIGQSGAHPGTSYLASNLINTNKSAGTGPFFNIWAMDGHQKYGGLMIANALWAPEVVGPPSAPPQAYYMGNPVLKFHDFTLLRKKYTLATATHIDIQYVVMMENWRGGYKGALASAIPGTTGGNAINTFYRQFRSGVGEDTFSWVHPDLGNMINFDAADEEDPYWDLPGPRLLWGNVYIASRYSAPGTRIDSTGNLIDVGSTYTNTATGSTEQLGGLLRLPTFLPNQANLLSDAQSIFMIEPNGATYLAGLSILKSTSANSFKSSTYLHNTFGESAIALSLESGLPMLGGYRSNEWSYVGLGNLMWSLPIYAAGTLYPLISGINPDFYPANNINDGGLGASFVTDLSEWYGLMSRGHGSLRQPYAIRTPDTSGVPASINITGGSTAGLPVITTFDPDINNLFVGMLVTSGAGYLPTTGPVYIESLDASGGIITLTENILITDPINGYNFYPRGGIEGSPVNDPRTRPNVYLVNLCATKTDVYEPFDSQKLVWTGYYKSLLNVNIDTGYDAEDDNYYYGQGSTSSSEPVFGGDTYLCKYSYRTTSNLYGLGRFNRGVNRYLDFSNPTGSQDDYLFGDIPIDLTEGRTPSFGTNIFGTTSDYDVLRFGGSGPYPQGGDEIEGLRRSAVTTDDNWSKNGNVAFSTIYQFIVESDDNINYRHAGDPEAGVSELNSMYFDKYVAADVLWRSPLGDLTKMDNILYEDHYSASQDIRVTIPFPKEAISTPFFPNRVIRSSAQDGNFNDTYRYFLGLQYKDFAVNRGQITNIFNLKALLYIHTEKSLFRTKGKQNLELSDATQAYIGSGDLFAQEPDEFIQSTEGYNGLYNKMGSLVTKDGYIFVSRKSRKIFLVKDEIVDLTELGINAWARENIPFALEAYGWDPDGARVMDSAVYNVDSPTADFGFLVSYDPLFKRTIITKRELIPTQYFVEEFKQNRIFFQNEKNQFYDSNTSSFIPLEEGVYFERGGWTISFSNGMSIWASRHSYIPPLYAYNSKYLYSFDTQILPFVGQYTYMYEHSDLSNPGNFYGTVYNFEIDCIFTAPVNAIYTSFKYTADVFSKVNYSLPVEQQFHPGFTSFYVYNTTQISGEIDFVYLNNIRKTDNTWNVNAFRDLSNIANNTGLAVGQINVQGVPYTSTFASTSTEPMFLYEGIINSNYINSNKPWYEQRKFVDKFLGIRLIANNLSRNLINLYTVTAALRVSPR
jgi:hypothetical protein